MNVGQFFLSMKLTQNGAHKFNNRDSLSVDALRSQPYMDSTDHGDHH